MTSPGFFGRVTGLLVFLLGVGMLVTVFWQSWMIYQDPGLTSSAAGTGMEGLVSRLTVLVVRLAFLLAMSVAASLISSKGVQLYLASAYGPPPVKGSIPEPLPGSHHPES